MLTLMVGYIVLGLSIAAPFGPINAEIIKRGIVYGFGPAFCVGLGGMSSDLLLMGCMFIGLAQLLTIVWIKIALMLLGCFILVHSGLVTLSQTHDLESQQSNLSPSTRIHLRSFTTGVIIASTNPMNLLFWLGIYGSVLSGALEETDVLHSFFVSSLVFIGIGLWNLNLAFTVHFGKLLMSPIVMKGINGIASVVLIGFGLKFGYDAAVELWQIFLL
ncbi:LysE family translocator [Pontibacillus salicampi]|uniref:LysE family translocator n=1 Tax=Pontibacillus salicampi TaxID=1449801 RepID=A0ABV6LQQ7_9BACI